jgi:hypothetical protein
MSSLVAQDSLLSGFLLTMMEESGIQSEKLQSEKGSPQGFNCASLASQVLNLAHRPYTHSTTLR